MSDNFLNLNKKITNCNKCSRLVKFRNEISLKKRKQNLDEVYWGKPVTGLGDNQRKMLILGLAPAAHGGTRTGRAFTGGESCDFYSNAYFLQKFQINEFLKILTMV